MPVQLMDGDGCLCEIARNALVRGNCRLLTLHGEMEG